jgi:sentrin-specific protease 8
MKAIEQEAFIGNALFIHRSLLVYSKDMNMFFHYDSLLGANANVARKHSKVMGYHFGASSIAGYTEMASPRQENGFDCGVYVIAITENLARSLSKFDVAYATNIGNDQHLRVSSNIITPACVTKYRRQLQELIVDMSNQ